MLNPGQNTETQSTKLGKKNNLVKIETLQKEKTTNNMLSIREDIAFMKQKQDAGF